MTVTKMVAVLFFCLIGMMITIAVTAPPRISREPNVPPYKVEPTTTITARP